MEGGSLHLLSLIIVLVIRVLVSSSTAIHPSIYPSIHSSIHSSIHPFIHPSIETREGLNGAFVNLSALNWRILCSRLDSADRTNPTLDEQISLDLSSSSSSSCSTLHPSPDVGAEPFQIDTMLRRICAQLAYLL